jgi:hypothetical protein
MRFRLLALVPLVAVPVVLRLAVWRAAGPVPNDTPRALWVAGQQGAARVNESGRVQLLLGELRFAQALALDRQRLRLFSLSPAGLEVWSWSGERLAKLAALTSPKPPARGFLAVLESDGSAWVARGQELLHLDAQAVPLGRFLLAEQAQALALDQHSRTLWVGGQTALFPYDAATGTPLPPISLRTGGPVQAASLAEPGLLWVLAREVLLLLERGEVAWALPWPGARALAAFPGGVWVLDNRWLSRLRTDGQVAVQLRVEDAAAVRALAANPRDGSVWLVFPNRARRSSPQGEVTVELALPSLGAAETGLLYVDTFPPQLFITFPRPGSCTNQPRLVVEGEWQEVGTGLDPASFTVWQGEQALAASCSTTENRFACELAATLADDAYALRVTARDREGNQGEARTDLQVDTRPPAFLALSPADGSSTNQTQLQLAGRLSEAAHLTINGQAYPVAEDGSFAAQLPLAQEGANAFSLVAADCAGNQASASLLVYRDTVPPAPPVLAKLRGQALASGLRVEAQPGACEPETLALVENPRTGDRTQTPVGADGSFALELGGRAGDTVTIQLQDRAGNLSAPVSLLVGLPLPPDPQDVAPPLPSSQATGFAEGVSFLWQGPNPVQFDTSPGFIEPRRVVVLRGKVRLRDGSPGEGVKVSVVGQEAAGYTVTREDGSFDLAVNGGGLLRVSFSKPGFLPVERQLATGWNDFYVLEDVVLTPLDPVATEVSFGATAVQVARGSTVADGDGPRTATLLVPEGATAELLSPDGTVQLLSAGHVRITEYTVGQDGPKAMPAPLPPNVAYTYCVDIRLDEAGEEGQVRFSQPLPFYVDNFLGFAVGTGVPLGSLDPREGVWKPHDNGVVLKILATDGGIATVDLDGDGQGETQETLARWGFTSGELAKLASLYPPARSFGGC